MNIVWTCLIIASIAVSFVLGNPEEVINQGIKSAGDSVGVVMSFAGMLCFWSGILEIMERSGISGILEKVFHPVTRLFFPNLKKGSKGLKCITENIVANFLGMGNAATPAGIEAMKELDKINNGKAYPSEEMCIFTLINTASVQLIPTTVISLRASFGVADSEKIIPAVWLTSIISLIFSILTMKLILKLRKKGGIGV